MIKLHTFLVHILPFKASNCSFSHLLIDNTTDMFICQVQRSKVPPRMYMTENKKWHTSGMLETGQSQNSVARHFAKTKSNLATGVMILTEGWGQD